MKSNRILRWRLTAAAVAMSACLGCGAAVPAAAAAEGAVAGVQVLTRGPVHEAFAETVSYNPEPGIVASKAPPADIEEIPPAQRPEGANVAWIPGYYSWDDDQSDFIWVSGIWRSLPPGRQWVPGYWAKSPPGAQWISGYWADAKAAEVEYLPEPPQSVEAGPSVAAPSDDQTWLPGSWVWQQNRYAWRPGYWGTMYANWDWVPAHYVWAPRGYVFVDGYYDYTVARRGLLFAPVQFDPSVYAQAGFRYSPAVVINSAVLANYLFVRPSCSSYYFGDYFGANYATAGFYPSCTYNSGRYGYDPIFAHDRWEHRQDPNWDRTAQANFENLRDHANLRPPRTWAAEQALGAGAAGTRGHGVVMAAPLDRLANSKDSPLHLQPVTSAERQTFGERGQAVHQFRDDRLKQETGAAAGRVATPGAKADSAKLPRSPSPIVAAPLEQIRGEYALPKAHDYPKPDLGIAPQPRKPAVNSPPARAAPNTVQPVTPRDAPRAETPRAEAPKTEAPRTEAPRAVAPRPVAPKAEAPKAEPPRAEPPRAEAPRAEAPGGAAPNGGAPKAEPPKH